MNTEVPLLVQWWNYFWAYERFPLFGEVLAVELFILAMLAWLYREEWLS